MRLESALRLYAGGPGSGRHPGGGSWALKQGDRHGPQQNWVKEGTAHVEEVDVDGIVTRESAGPRKTAEFKEAFERGAQFPMVEGYKDEQGVVHIAEGHHRLAAWKALGHKKIPMVVSN